MFAVQLIPIERSNDQLLPSPPADSSGRGPLIQPINDPGVTVTAVPEPATWGMLVLGAGLLTGVRRFRRK